MGKFLFTLVFLSFLGIQSYAQKTVTGTVTSASDGSEMPGVTVVVKGTQVGTITANDGSYSIEVPQGADTLMFSFIGMNSVKKAIGNQTVINVQMVSAVTELDELVVTALGISREKKALGYAVQEVGGDDLAEAKEANIVNSLSGKVAGTQVTNASGAVGSSSRITIRGNSSFTNNQPLWVVDGVPISNASSDVSQWGATDFGNAAMDLDPSNIESLTVLKGANAAAIYGSRAANGVIVVKTKTGEKAKKGIGVNISSAITFDQAYNFANYQNEYGQGVAGSEYYYLTSGANFDGASYQDFADGSWNGNYGFFYYDGGASPDDPYSVNDNVDESWGPRLDAGLEIPQFNSPLTDPNDPMTRQATPWVSRPDNVKNFFQTGVTFDNSVTLTSNGEMGAMRLSLSHFDQKGTVPNTDLTKYTVSFNGTQNMTEWLKSNVTFNYVNNASDNLPVQGYSSNNPMQSMGGWFGRQVNMEALEAHYDELNVFGNPYNWNTNYHNNPYWNVNYNTTSRTRDRVFGTASVDAEITDWVKVTGRVGVDYYSEVRKHVDRTMSNEQPYGAFWQSDRNNMEVNADLFASFSKEFGDVSVDGILGTNFRRNEYGSMYLEAAELTVPNLFTISNVRGNPSTDMYDETFETNSVYAQASIGWRRAIFLDMTARNDWSSTLPADEWSYFYPSFTGSVIINELLELESDILSFAKIRGGWAKVGNDTDPYQLSLTYGGVDPFGNVTPFATSRLLPPVGLKPEQVTSTEIGLDLRFLKNRFSLDFTYYDQITYDQILQIDISQASGFDNQLINAGEIENKGFEVQLGATWFKDVNGFSWTTTVNWAKNWNQVNELYGDLEAYQITSSWGGLTIEARPGQAFGVIKAGGFVYDEDGNKVIGANGLPLTTDAPVEVGNITPDWTGGVRNTFSYKTISLSVLVDGRYGGDLFSVSDWFGAYAGVTEETAQDGIRENGLVVEGVSEDGTPNDVVISAADYYAGYWGREVNSVIDGSYIKLRELVLSYKIPQKIISKVGFIEGASVSFVGRNLAMLYIHPSNDVGIDPETGFGANLNGLGLEQFQLPTARTLGFRVNLNF
ncbi:TonB-linked outer membrane protein, SusC/RagA family [Salinivirga cyanobacteriivorans]|uniref:TonB-linked outer membrane protein, SusC/RagA family n=1 Tax=Salinivirga cyanobacteriivorans TaxID=1307839 RepID=A0A0S2HZB7_9BACT|nr:SusC/RagA family TonB-linked outer membrane protein [Salinivirga cyanobacteriivorans]ALO15285.1 TonB-linked outer membrane protein, SusC/RagA family [Salinivirga cyanobacteriivorans]